ncbi:MAG TPA: hypothetical protein VG939_08850 [Caulobacteraceae bacterium]|nr:hypothetical protein [Caulobacteraceae bacterium]
MRDRIALPLLALIAIAMVALAFVWPQGQGRRSPPPFGHPMTPVPRRQAPAPRSHDLLDSPAAADGLRGP